MGYMAIGAAIAAGWWLQAPAWLWCAYAMASAACLALYAFDKHAAVHRRARTPERTLLLVALLGGWPGALLGQRWLRHKSSKTSFLVKSWTVVAVHQAAAGWLAFQLR